MHSRWSPVSARLGILAMLSLAAGDGMAQDADAMAEIFVTATARPEARSRIAATTQVIDRAAIERSTAKSVTDLLAENAVGFFSEWTAAQTSINIRGATSDGQGRDYKGQVLVLVNGRRRSRPAGRSPTWRSSARWPHGR